LEKYRSFDEIQFALKKGESDCQSIVKYYLQNIQTKAHLNAFVEVYAQSALEQAALVDAKIAQGKAGKLAGMIVGIKDVLNYEGDPASLKGTSPNIPLLQFKGSSMKMPSLLAV
jgi:aspartyl-tRNA(Asn)/glutamyl-tRNA(Gln) amidotransferase subunit A